MDLRAFARLGLMACAIAACAGPAFGKPPDCSARLVKRTVLSLAQKHAPLPDRFSYVLDAIKVVATKDNEASCAADLLRVYRESAVYQSRAITYTVTRNPDGELYVSVENLPR
jgi:hypothetical protein